MNIQQAAKILGISENATEQEIRIAHHNLCKKWHPDRNPGNEKEAERRTKEINEAADVLRRAHATGQTSQKNYQQSGHSNQTHSNQYNAKKDRTYQAYKEYEKAQSAFVKIQTSATGVYHTKKTQAEQEYWYTKNKAFALYNKMRSIAEAEYWDIVYKCDTVIKMAEADYMYTKEEVKIEYEYMQSKGQISRESSGQIISDVRQKATKDYETIRKTQNAIKNKAKDDCVSAKNRAYEKYKQTERNAIQHYNDIINLAQKELKRQIDEARKKRDMAFQAWQRTQ